MSYQATRRNVGILNALCSVKEASTKAIYYVILTIGHSGKGQSIEIKKKDHWLPGEERMGNGWVGGTQGIFRAVKLFYDSLVVDT